MFSRADTNENMEVEDDVNKTLPEDKSEDEGEDTLKAGDSKFNYVSYIFLRGTYFSTLLLCVTLLLLSDEDWHLWCKMVIYTW